MRVLIAASGSYGDIFPFIAIGRELGRRGHDVRFFASSYFSPLAAEAGLTPIGIGPAEAYEAIIRHPDAFHPRKGFRLIAETNLQWLPETYRLMDEQVSPGETVVIGSTLAISARLFQETRGIPTVTAHLAPSIFRSAERPPRFSHGDLPERLPPLVNRALFWFMDTFVVDPFFCAGFNRFRAGLGLAPMKRMFGDWIHGADLVIGLFPEWYGKPQRDWPGNFRLTGFPLFDGARTTDLGEDASAFLERAKRPVIFTAGTAATSETSFFEESAEACRLTGIEGILLTRYRKQLPRELPGSVRHFSFLPFSLALPRVAAIVHHGGIGTSSQALRAGTPQLLRPLAYDQFDNAHRLEELGVARSIPSKRYRARAVAEALEDLTTSSSIRNACDRIRRKIEEGGDAVSATCDAVVKLTNS